MSHLASQIARYEPCIAWDADALHNLQPARLAWWVDGESTCINTTPLPHHSIMCAVIQECLTFAYTLWVFWKGKTHRRGNYGKVYSLQCLYWSVCTWTLSKKLWDAILLPRLAGGLLGDSTHFISVFPWLPISCMKDELSFISGFRGHMEFIFGQLLMVNFILYPQFAILY